MSTFPLNKQMNKKKLPVINTSPSTIKKVDKAGLFSLSLGLLDNKMDRSAERNITTGKYAHHWNYTFHLSDILS